MRTHLHDSNPGDELDMSMKATPQELADMAAERDPVPVETLKDEQGQVVEIYSYHPATDDCPATAQTNSGAIFMSRVVELRKLAEMDPVDLGKLAVRIDRDPGASARDRVLTRGQKVKRAMVRTYLLILTVVVLFVAGAVGYVYYEFTKPGKRMVNYSACSFVDEKSGIEVTGRRENSYLERSLFGVNFRLEKDIEHKTQIDIKGDPITAVGINKDGTSWNKFADLGERGIMILQDADQYVFATKKKAVVVGYSQFCH